MTDFGYTRAMFDEAQPEPPKRVCELCHEEQDASAFVKSHGRSLSKRCGTCRGQNPGLLWFKSNRQRAYVAHRNWMLRSLYDMSQADYLARLEAQGGGCAICGSTDPGLGNAGTRKHFAIDHNHKTGRMRGLLCNRCNRFIGLMNDDPELLSRAVDYLRSFD